MSLSTIARPNPWIEKFFSASIEFEEPNLYRLITAGVRDPAKGEVRYGDVCGINRNLACSILSEAAKIPDYAPKFLEKNTFMRTRKDGVNYRTNISDYGQIVDHKLGSSERSDQQITNYMGRPVTIEDIDFQVNSGGLANRDAMLACHPGIDSREHVFLFDRQYTVENPFPTMASLKEARVVLYNQGGNRIGRDNLVFNYPEAVEDKELDIHNYTWWDMVQGKDSKGPWDWSILRVSPGGKAVSVFESSGVPSSIIKGAALLYVGKGLNPYNPNGILMQVVGDRGTSTKLGGYVLDWDRKMIESIRGGRELLRDIQDELDELPSGASGIQMVVECEIDHGEASKVELGYVVHVPNDFV